MGSPAIFKGARTGLLSSRGLLLKDGTTIDNDGIVNFIKNNAGVTGTTSWTEGSYTAATRPSGSFTASSGAGAFAISTTTTTPLGTGTTSFLLTKSSGASRQGRAVETSFALPLSYRAKVLQISIDYIINSGTFVAGDSATDSSLIWYCAFSTDNGATYTVAEPSSFKLLSNSTTISDKFSGSIQTPSDATNMKLIAYVAETANSAWEVKCIASVSPTQYVYGTPVTDWVSYTPTLKGLTDPNIGSTGTITGFWRRVGDSIQIRAKAVAGGTGITNGTGDYYFTPPSGINLDTTKITGTAVQDSVGTGNVFNSGVAGYNVSCVVLGAGKIGITTDGSSLVGQNFPASNWFSSGDVIEINTLPIPVQGWSSSVQMSDQADTRVVSLTAYRTGSAITATAGATTEVVFNTIETNGDTTGQYSTSTGRFTASTPGWYRVSSNLQIAMGATAASSVACYALKNGTGAFIGYDYTDNLTNAKTYTFQINDKVFLNSGDYISIWVAPVTQNVTVGYTGGSNHVSSISIERISGPNQIAASETVAARYNLGSSQSIANATTAIINFSNKVYDTHGAVTTGASWKFTAPISGTYQINGNILYASAAFTAYASISLALYKNGTWTSATYFNPFTTSTYLAGSLIFNDSIKLNAGDYIDLRTNHGETTARSTQAGAEYMFVDIVRIGA